MKNPNVEICSLIESRINETIGNKEERFYI